MVMLFIKRNKKNRTIKFKKHIYKKRVLKKNGEKTEKNGGKTEEYRVKTENSSVFHAFKTKEKRRFLILGLSGIQCSMLFYILN